MSDSVLVAIATVVGGLVSGFFVWLTMRAQKAPDLHESANKTVETIGEAYALTLKALEGQISMLTGRIAAMNEHIGNLEEDITSLTADVNALTAALLAAGQPLPELAAKRPVRRRKPPACTVSE